MKNYEWVRNFFLHDEFYKKFEKRSTDHSDRNEKQKGPKI